VSLPHRVNNRSARDRIHLVIDADVNEWVHELFRRAGPAPRIAPSPAGFAEFASRVFADPELQNRLHAIPEREDFAAETVRLGRESGFDFHGEDVEAGGREPTIRAARPQAGWTPIAFRARDSRPFAEWAYFGARRFTEPFFEDTLRAALQLPFTQTFRQETCLEPGDDPAPAGFIFHMSRCGSTLAAQMLAALPRNTVLSEAQPIDEAIRTSRADWLRFVVSALAGRASGPVFIKLDAWHIHSLPLIREAFPETPWIFLHRDICEVAASHWRSPGRQALPGAMDPAILGLRQEDITGLSREEWCARVLAGFRESAERFRDDPQGLFIDYRELPDAMWTRIAPHFGLSLTDEEAARMRTAASFDAKNPAMLFQPAEAQPK